MRASVPSKTWVTWAAVVGGWLGLHRLVLHGLRDPWAWLHLPPALLGLWGFQRIRQFGIDDPQGAFWAPLLGVMIAQGMFCAILVGLTPDERWAERHTPPGVPVEVEETRWGPVLGVITALMVGATAMMGVIAYVGQKFFESMAPTL